MQLGFGGKRRAISSFCALVPIAIAAACGSNSKHSPAGASGAGGTSGVGVFGGSGGVIEAVPVATSGSSAGGTSGSSGAAGSSTTNECQNTPIGTLALIDDFEDGDSVAAFEPNRDAYWFTIQDGTAGTLDPPNTFLPVPGGYLGGTSAHVSASGFTLWGAELVANITHKEAVRCPYDASGFAGLSFVARGHGRVRVQFAVPGTVDKEFGGTCDPAAGQTCYDFHGVFVTLGDDYARYELPWASFQQRNFGKQFPFDPKTITALHFSMEKDQLPVELWLDDVKFWDGKPSEPIGAGGEAGGPAFGGAAGDGGSPAFGGAGGEAIGGAGGVAP
jgi:hypothetical protein